MSAITSFASAVAESFGIYSFQLVSGSGTSFTTTPRKDDFIKCTCKQTHGLKFYSVTSGMKTSGVGSVLCKIKDDGNDLTNLQIDRVLRLEKVSISVEKSRTKIATVHQH